MTGKHYRVDSISLIMHSVFKRDLANVLYKKKTFIKLISAIAGRARLTCDIDERWNGPPPRCEPILCDPPAMVAHSYIQIDEIDEGESVSLKNNFNRSLLVGSIVTYTCEKGYRLVGFRQILCLATGLYDHVAPTCIGI